MLRGRGGRLAPPVGASPTVSAKAFGAVSAQKP